MHQAFYQDQVHSPVALTPLIVQNYGDYEEDFIQAMSRVGIDFIDKIIAYGKIHRFSVDKKGHKNSWYVFYGMAGAFGDWSRDIHEKWSLNNKITSGLDKEDLFKQIQRVKQKVEEERNQKHEETAQLAFTKWQSYSEVGVSPYLIRKKVEPFGIRYHNEHVIIPVKDVTGKLWSLQSIHADGAKRFLPGGRKKGCFHNIGTFEDGNPILVCEGYTTGASIHMATHQLTVIAFDAGNLEPVIEELRKVYPNSPRNT